jgi:hypothetical protein
MNMLSRPLLWTIVGQGQNLAVAAFTDTQECAFRIPVSSPEITAPFILQVVAELNEAGSLQEQETIAAGLTSRLLLACLAGMSQSTSTRSIMVFEVPELFEDIPNTPDMKLWTE